MLEFSIVALAAVAICGTLAVVYSIGKTKEIINLFMIREAKAMERISKKAKNAMDNAPRTSTKKAPDAMPAGEGNRRFRTWPK